MACLDHPFEHPSVQGRNPSDSNEAGGTPQEARIREEVRLTPMKLDRPESSWLDTNTNGCFYLFFNNGLDPFNTIRNPRGMTIH